MMRTKAETGMLLKLVKAYRKMGYQYVSEIPLCPARLRSNIDEILARKAIHSADLWQDEDGQKFIKDVLDRWPKLICEIDDNGCNPLHSIARDQPNFIDRSVLYFFHQSFNELKKKCNAGELYLAPWRMKNKHGNTPLHEALLSEKANLRCVDEFLNFDGALGNYENNNLDTPLHLLSHVTNISIRSYKAFNPSTAYKVPDKDRLTPLLKGAQENNLPLVKLLYHTCPKSACETKRDDGQIFWHVLASQASIEFDSDYKNKTLIEFLDSFDGDELLYVPYDKEPGYYARLLYKSDNDGKTPLHLAIEKGNFRFAQFLIEYALLAEEEKGITMPNILNIRDKKDLTPIDQIGSVEHIPRQFENFLWSKPRLVKELLGVRSLSGLSILLVKDYTNTLSVVAALLATITFTAAFTVPGGLNQEKGFPILLTRAAFQVFMVSDILAMCLSMMVLFCLLWIMTMGNKKELVVLLDLTIFLLQFSFYATLLAFMTGLYVTVSSITPWIAIFSCILCSFVILVMHKSFIALCIPSFIRVFFLSRKTSISITQLCSVLGGVFQKAIICCSNQANEKSKEGPVVSDGRVDDHLEQASSHEPNWKADY